MSQCVMHRLILSPGNILEPDMHVHVLSDKPADVVDMTCPSCGKKIFVYYRVLGDEHTRETEKEAGDYVYKWGDIPKE